MVFPPLGNQQKENCIKLAEMLYLRNRATQGLLSVIKEYKRPEFWYKVFMQRAGKENYGSSQTTHTVDAFKISVEIFLCSILNTAKPKHHLKSNVWCSGAPYVACMISICCDQSNFASQTSKTILPGPTHSLCSNIHL